MAYRLLIESLHLGILPLVTLCINHFSANWTTQHYYDVGRAEVCIAVEEPYREEARRCLREFSDDDYKIVDPWKSSYDDGMVVVDHAAFVQQTQTELCPGDKIRNTSNGKRVLFSGSIRSNRYEVGMTVAHAFGRGNGIKVECEADTATPDVGRCRESFNRLVREGGEELTADLALLDLNTASCSVANTVWWPKRGHSSRTLQIKIYRGPEIAEDSGVMILDQNGEFRYGCIRRTRLSDGSLQDVLGICASEQEEVAITKPGDSGALVMSLPNNENNTVYIYGICTGIYKISNEKSMTIANSLGKVIHEISSNGRYFPSSEVDNIQDVDFV